MLDAGHDVEIYKRSQFKNEVGAAIMAPPNFARILAHYKVDEKRSQATAKENFIFYHDSSDLNKSITMPITHCAAKYKAPFDFFYRVDLNHELRKLATEPTPTRSRVARIRLVTAVSSVEIDGTVTLDDKTTVKNDLIVAADNIRASFLQTVVGHKIEAEHKVSMLRFLVPTQELEKDAETLALFKEGYSSARIVYHGDKSAVFYGCREIGTLQNVALSSVLRAGGATVSDCEDIQGERWKKIVANGTWNPLCALSRCRDLQLLAASPLTLQVVNDIMREICAVAAAFGHAKYANEEAIAFQLSRPRARDYPGVEPSMMDAGREMEVEAIRGGIVKA
ncbi:salicylate hydroxylase [Fusarium napiforme]|uniref:Salicylate hydroxylase n=1 Tax=Fusarium napiforme TaxID=42672 RepID=A0A8H5MZW2_9HYPO|nr:salicylate hydroxylase [Fusarium napiforme]